MRLLSPLFSRVWIAVPLLVAGFLVWSCKQRVQRVEYITNVVSGDAVISDVSPTGYAGGVRNLIVPEQNHDSCRWVAQTQQMLARGEWRIRKIDYENAPIGREVFTPSPYRWWLGLVAWVDHAFSGRPLGLAVERAALYADPLLHLLLLVVAVVFTAWRFGAFPAALLSLGIAVLFPFSASYLPGLPDDKALSRACTFLSVLVLLAGTRTAGGATGSARVTVRDQPQGGRWFFTAGIIGGFGLWVSVAEQVPVILGTAIGAVLATWVLRREKENNLTRALSSANWLRWALGGAMSSLIFYLVEYYPAHLAAWRLQHIHPLYSLAWLGLGAALMGVTALIRREASVRGIRLWVGGFFAIASLSAVPVLMWKSGEAGFFAVEAWSFRLTRLAGSTEATNLWAWLSRDGFSATVWATLLPALLVLPAGWLLWHRSTAANARLCLALALGPVLVALGLACWQLGRWNNFGAVLLALLVAITVGWGQSVGARSVRWLWSGCLGLLLLPGAILLRPPMEGADQAPLNESELAGLIARDLAHWMAKHTGSEKTVVLAPPTETTALYYYGGLPGIGTLSWENQTAIGAASRIFSATTPQEALARIRSREVTHIVVPSWDRYLDEYVRINVVQVNDTFLSGLRNWAPLPWLKPVAYQLPAVSGYEGQSVAVFEVVEEQSEATVLGWQAECFADRGQLEYAAAVSQSLQRFPADLGAWIARAQVAMARKDAAGLADALKALTPKLTAGADRSLPWDRRVGLAVVLAQGKQMDLAREQVRRCLTEANEKRLRSASTGSLFRLLMLAKLFGLEIGDPALRKLAPELLPPDWRSRL